MKNKIGFVPKSAPVQPDYYRNIFNGWCAVFLTHSDEEFHLQMNLDPWAHQTGYEQARSISILKQTPNHRAYVWPHEVKTVKEACQIVARAIARSEQKAIQNV